MSKLVVLAAAAVAAVGLTVAAPSSAEAQYYGPGVSIHIGAPHYHGPYGYRPYRPHYAYRPYRVYRPYYAYRPPVYAYGAPYGVRYARPYGPVCARWVWRINHYGERRRRCVAW